MDFQMKKRLLIALVSISASGCAVKSSDGRDFPDLSPVEIYKNKLAHCENSVSYEQVTEFVGNDRTFSPEERRTEKDNEWKRWQQELLNTKSEVSQNLYIVKIPAAFQYYDKSRNRMRLTEGKQNYQSEGIFSNVGRNIEFALPSKILINSTKVDDVFYSAPLPEGVPYYHGGVSKWVARHFGNQSTTADNVYVINRVHQSFPDGKSFIGINGAYGGVNQHGHWQLGVGVDSSNWMNHPQSPIYKEDSSIYLDLSKFNFLDSFGVYPDTGTVYINVEYIFSINSCDKRVPQGKLKELIVSSWNEVTKNYIPISKLVF